jgi:hypothetical protein
MMPVESAATISGFDSSYPLPNDPMLQGDDHLRLIKAVLKSQFPGVGGQGFAKVITATEDQINSLTGVTGNIQNRLAFLEGNLLAPSGTVMLFGGVVPTGWSVVPQANDRLLILTGNAGNTGGSESPYSFNKSHAHSTQSQTLTQNQIPSHTHTLGDGAILQQGQANLVPFGGTTFGYSAISIGSAGYQSRVGFTGQNDSHNHGDTLGSSVSWTPRYNSVVFGVKI